MANTKLRGLGIGYKNPNHEVVCDVVIEMKENGRTFKFASEIVASERDLTLQAVRKYHCVEALSIWDGDEFNEFVEDGRIIDRLKKKHPEHSDYIDKRLGHLYESVFV